MDDIVKAVNELTRNWLREIDATSNLVVSGAGVWALLSALAAGASGPARNELQLAIGIDLDAAHNGLNELLHVLCEGKGLSSAFGIWSTPQAPVRAEYAALFPALTVDPIPDDPAELDKWVQRETQGVLNAFPTAVTKDTLLIAATALTAVADWCQPFHEFTKRDTDGNEIGWLSRKGSVDHGAVLSSSTSEVVRVICETEGDFDVHLLTANPEVAADALLATGIAAASLDPSIDVLATEALEVGSQIGGLSVAVSKYESAPSLSLSLPAFELDSSWDLTEHSKLFGLQTAQDETRGHFDTLAPFPLAVEAARQKAAAGFSASGFRAAAVTAAAVAAAGVPPTYDPAKIVYVDFADPFGFLVVHRTTGLVLFAGWVSEPNGQVVPWQSAQKL